MENKDKNTPNIPAKSSGTSSNKTVFIAVISVLAIALAVMAYLFLNKNKQLEESGIELKGAYDQLDSISQELEIKIVEIEKLGGDITELEEVKAQLEKEKEDLWKSKKYSDSQLKRFQAKVEGYRELLVAKDEEIAKLQKVNEELEVENRTLKSEKVNLEQNITELQEEQDALTEKVTIASKLLAENIKVAALNKKGKEKKGVFKVRHLDKLKVDFNIAKNDVAPIEGKTIYLRISDANGEVLFDIEKGGGTLMLDGQETFYTLKQEILFDNTEQNISFLYDKDSDYLPGDYTMAIYTDGYQMGTQKFSVK